jgi:hypothetical protein
MAKKTIGAGFRAIFYGVLNSSGIFIGSTVTVPPVGTTTNGGMLRLDGAQTIPVQIGESVIVVQLGDDEPMVSFEFDSADLPSGVLQVAQADNVFDALVQGTKVQTVGDLELSALDPKGRESQPMCLLLQRRSKSWLSGERGSAKFEVFYILSCSIKPLGATLTQREVGPWSYSINLSRGDVGLGMSINETDHGTTAMSIQRVDTDNPLHRVRGTGDGATLTYPLTYAPVSAAKTYVNVDQIRQTVTVDYSISGTSLIFVVAPANNAVIDVVYEVDEGTIF